MTQGHTPATRSVKPCSMHGPRSETRFHWQLPTNDGGPPGLLELEAAGEPLRGRAEATITGMRRLDRSARRNPSAWRAQAATPQNVRMTSKPDLLAPLRAMLSLLDDNQRDVLARALHQPVYAPATRSRAARRGTRAAPHTFSTRLCSCLTASRTSSARPTTNDAALKLRMLVRKTCRPVPGMETSMLGRVEPAA